MKAMILAAGEGTRLRPFTLQLPKPAIPFLGVPLAFYGLHLAREVGVNEIVVNHFHLSGEIKSLFQGLPGYQVQFSDESEGLLGSGGGIHKARPFLENETTFLVLNGDEIILPKLEGQLKSALEHHERSNNIMTILVKDHPDVGTKFGGVWADPQNKVIQFSKTPIASLKGWHYTGIILFSNRIFAHFKNAVVEENILYETAAKAMQAGEKVEAYPIQCEWFETGNPTDFLTATQTCVEKLEAPAIGGWSQWLWNFLKTQQPRSPLVEANDPMMVKKIEMLWQRLKAP